MILKKVWKKICQNNLNVYTAYSGYYFTKLFFPFTYIYVHTEQNVVSYCGL